MKIQNHGKLHFYSICDCQVINFPMFLWRCSMHEMGHFWEFLSLNSPKYCQIFAKFSPEVVFKETQTVFQEFWKNSNFCRTGRHLKFVRLVWHWPHFFPWRWPKIEKNKLITRLNLAIRVSKYVNGKAVSPLPFQWKIGLPFALFERFLGKYRRGYTLKGRN